MAQDAPGPSDISVVLDDGNRDHSLDIRVVIATEVTCFWGQT